MITLRRASERQHDQRNKHEVWRTFSWRSRAEQLADGFGSLEFLDEHRLSPRARVSRKAAGEAETVTYVRDGTIAYHDSTGRSGVIHAGEFQCTTIRRGEQSTETNASRTDSAHFFRASLVPPHAGLEPNQEQRRFGLADRRGGLCVVASPDARKNSLRIQQDALIYSALFDSGQHVAYELSQGRSVWLHLLQGEVALGDIALTSGDGAGLQAERSVSFTAIERTELLLIDVGDLRLTDKIGATRA